MLLCTDCRNFFIGGLLDSIISFTRATLCIALSLPSCSVCLSVCYMPAPVLYLNV